MQNIFKRILFSIALLAAAIPIGFIIAIVFVAAGIGLLVGFFTLEEGKIVRTAYDNVVKRRVAAP